MEIHAQEDRAAEVTDFIPAFNRTMDFEGRTREHVPGDSGGDTYWGISRVSFPTWPGWPMLDANQLVPTVLVQGFYQHNFWLPAACDRYQSQELANQIFDAFVNLGPTAIKILRNLIAAPHDGMPVGKTTLDILAKWNQDTLADTFIQARAAHYKAIVEANPNDGKFLAGWLNRCVRSA